MGPDGEQRRRAARRTWLPVMLYLLAGMTGASDSSSAFSTEPSATDYSGWRILKLQLGEKDPSFLDEYEDHRNLQLLKVFRGSAEVAVSPSAFGGLTELLSSAGVTYTTVLTDLARKLKANQPSLRGSPLPRGTPTFDSYMSHDEIVAYIESLAQDYPDIVKVEEVAQSVEGRPLYLVTVTSSVKSSTTKPVIFVDGGIHAREWISPAAAVFVLKKLVESPSFTRNVDWKIMPLLNPDGYIYSWTTDRLWRKNHGNSVRGGCSGVDLNRNFGFHWGESGSSSRPCSTIYQGPSAFSEPESRALRDEIMKVSSKMKAYISIHSYGQYVLHPWGYTTRVNHHNHAQLGEIGRSMATAIRNRDGTRYSVGHAGKLLYPASGASDDWVAGIAGVPLAYTIELRDKGYAGFLLPAYQILPAVNDAWSALKVLARHIRRDAKRIDHVAAAPDFRQDLPTIEKMAPMAHMDSPTNPEEVAAPHPFVSSHLQPNLRKYAYFPPTRDDYFSDDDSESSESISSESDEDSEEDR